MPRPHRLALLTLLTLACFACGDDGNPGSGDGTSTTGPTGDPTAASQPTTTTDDPGDTSGGMTAATTDVPTTAPAECEQDAQCPGGDNPCAAGRCSDGACELVPERLGTPQPDDPGNCMRAECDGMGAVHMVPEDDPPNDTPDDCQAPTCQDGAVKLVPADDPPADTLGDCKRTTCDAGEVTFVADDLDLPDDTIECTQDTCVDGTPAFPPKPTNSFCGPMGDMFCHADSECEPCKQVSEACEDETNTEANDTQMTAFDFGTISDADSAGDTICPVLDGPDDVDWYHYFGNDVFPNVVDPDRVVTSDMNARLCVYFDCEGNNSTSVGCNADEVEDIAPGGQAGCCGMGSVAPSLNCSGLDDAADVWIKVENVDMAACVGYQLDYHF
jgi:hypothetical protein